MKKVLAIVFVFCLLVCSAYATDYSQYSIEELVAMREAITNELYLRLGIQEGDFWNGVYNVGTDLEAGDYLITYVKQQGSVKPEIYVFSDDYALADAREYAYADSVYKKKAVFFGSGYETGDTIHIGLKDGNILIITAGQYTIEKLAGIKPW